MRITKRSSPDDPDPDANAKAREQALAQAELELLRGYMRLTLDGVFRTPAQETKRRLKNWEYED